jgi:hypothetical protein
MAIWNRRGPKAARKYPVPLTTHQLWMVSLSAPVSRDRDASRTTLYPFTRIDDDKAVRWLADHWGITSREELVGRLDGLARSGYRASARLRLGVEPLAWDAGLYADISRRGFAAGMLSEAEASLELCVCLSDSGFSGAAWPCAVAVVGSEPRGEGVDLGGVRVVEAGPLGGAGASSTGSV